MAYEYSMYCKLFKSLYQGTLRGRSHEILVFTNLLAHADANGHVDSHFKAIADEVGLTVDEVKAALLVLESPDIESRSPDEDGRRIIRLDEHRIWGWRIVNYAKYRAIRNEEDRKEQNRLAQERWRKKQKGEIIDVSHDKPQSSHAEEDAEVKAEAKPSLYSVEFEEFWKAYPRKVAKGAAWKAWKGTKGLPNVGTITAAIARQAESPQWQKDNGQFIPHPATWINSRRWEDGATEAADAEDPFAKMTQAEKQAFFKQAEEEEEWETDKLRQRLLELPERMQQE